MLEQAAHWLPSAGRGAVSSLLHALHEPAEEGDIDVEKDKGKRPPEHPLVEQ